MLADRKRLLMGGGVVTVLVVALWLGWPAAPSPSASGAVPARGTGPAARQGAQGSALAPVKIDALAEERAQPSEATRNPFRFQPKVAPPPPRAVAPPPPVVTETPRPVAPPGPPPLPPIPLKFIGVLTRADGEQWAVLSDGKVPLHGKEGDIVDGRYRIVKIGTESIELTYVDGRGRQVVRLTGQ